MKKKNLSKKLKLNKLKVVNLNEMQEIKGGRTGKLCISDDLTCISMCDFSCYVGTCIG